MSSSRTKKTNDEKYVLVIMNPQIDFCEGGTVALDGATIVISAIASFITKMSKKISEIAIVTDQYPFGHLLFASSWKHTNDTMPVKPFTTIQRINNTFYDSNNIKITPKHESKDTSDFLHDTYSSHINGILYPSHCIENTMGAAIHPKLLDALKKWSFDNSNKSWHIIFRNGDILNQNVRLCAKLFIGEKKLASSNDTILITGIFLDMRPKDVQSEIQECNNHNPVKIVSDLVVIPTQPGRISSPLFQEMEYITNNYITCKDNTLSDKIINGDINSTQQIHNRMANMFKFCIAMRKYDTRFKEVMVCACLRNGRTIFPTSVNRMALLDLTTTRIYNESASARDVNHGADYDHRYDLPTDPVSRAYYESKLIQFRKSAIKIHWLLENEPLQTPPTRNPFIALDSCGGRGIFPRFGPNFTQIVVFIHKGIATFQKLRPDKEDSMYYYFDCHCNMDPAFDIKDKPFKIVMSYVPTPAATRHAWLEASFFIFHREHKLTEKLESWEKKSFEFVLHNNGII